jgi:hypothetical protein
LIYDAFARDDAPSNRVPRRNTRNQNRLARTCSGHSRLETAIAGPKKDVDGRVKPGHSDFSRFEYGEVRIYAIGLVNSIEFTVIYTVATPTSVVTS